MTREEFLTKKVSAISLGCDKNRVDLEKILFSLESIGLEIVADPVDADVVIVNTCAFILPAKQESISEIIEMEFLKRHNKIEKIIVTGCFPERNYEELEANFPDVDAFVKIRNNENLPRILEELYGVEKSSSPKKGRVLTTCGSYAYLKIAEGCNNACSYCIIPRIRGRYKSASIPELVSEAEELAKKGVKELILVAQDVSRYGEDIDGKSQLIPLLKKLVKVKGIEWIRLHYLYPEKLSDEMLEYIATEEKICNYIDIPLQHIDDKILKSMRRRLDEENTRNLIKKIRENYPNLAIRTTFIVGYPGETRKQLMKLCQFLKEVKFEYAGFFPFYREENTSAYFLKKQIPNIIKQQRLKKVKSIQDKISTLSAEKMIGSEETVLIDQFDSQTGFYLGHTKKQSPGVDFGVLVEGEGIKVGDFVNVIVTDFDGNNFQGVKK